MLNKCKKWQFFMLRMWQSLYVFIWCQVVIFRRSIGCSCQGELRLLSMVYCCKGAVQSYAEWGSLCQTTCWDMFYLRVVTVSTSFDFLFILCPHILCLVMSKSWVCYVCHLVANIGKKGSVQTLFSLRSVFAGVLQRCRIGCSILSLFGFAVLQVLVVVSCFFSVMNTNYVLCSELSNIEVWSSMSVDG